MDENNMSEREKVLYGIIVRKKEEVEKDIIKCATRLIKFEFRDDSKEKRKLLDEMYDYICEYKDNSYEIEDVKLGRYRSNTDSIGSVIYSAIGAQEENFQSNFGNERDWLRHLYNDIKKYLEDNENG